MKKLLLTILLTMSPAFAYEDILIISPAPVNSVIVKDLSIVQAKPVFTIDNEKKFIIITPQKNGETEIEIKTPNNTQKIDIKIGEKTKLNLPKDLAVFEIDIPPENIDIPLPPEAIEIIAPPKLQTEEKGGK